MDMNFLDYIAFLMEECGMSEEAATLEADSLFNFCDDEGEE